MEPTANTMIVREEPAQELVLPIYSDLSEKQPNNLLSMSPAAQQMSDFILKPDRSKHVVRTGNDRETDPIPQINRNPLQCIEEFANTLPGPEDQGQQNNLINWDDPPDGEDIVDLSTANGKGKED